MLYCKKSLFYARLVRDPRANYKQSLEVLKHVKRIQPNMVTKSSLMLGLGETDDEVLQALKGKHYLIQINSPFSVNCFFLKKNGRTKLQLFTKREVFNYLSYALPQMKSLAFLGGA